NLGNAQHGGTGDPRRRQNAGEQQTATTDLKGTLHLDHAADITGIVLSQTIHDALAQRFDFSTELLYLSVGQVHRQTAGAGIFNQSGIQFHRCSHDGSPYSSRVTLPAAAQTQMRTMSPLSPNTSPLVRSRT